MFLIKLALRRKNENMKANDNFSEIGNRRHNIESIDKALGCAKFLPDLELPRMLYGRILRSPLPHAKILNIDTSKAERLLGVKSVISAHDTPRIKFCSYLHLPGNKLPLEDEKVRFVGDEVAAVAAIDEDIAREAVELIRVDYEELSSVYDPEEAMRSGAPQIHAEAQNNISSYVKREFGNIGEGFKISDYIFENRFETSAVSHCFMETTGCVAQFDLSCNLTVWLTTQSPFHLRKQLALVLNIPMSKIRVNKLYIGGGFGGKTALLPVEAICVFLAKKSGRPVKLINTREEQFATGRMRYPMIIELKTGVKRDGSLIARQARVITDNGAYDNKGASITASTCGRFVQLYKVPNVKYEAYVVFTNKQMGEAFRGRGGPQGVFAIECQMDIIAEGLGIDPAELRLKNANLPGEINPAGNRITSCALKECIEKVVYESGWKEKRNKPRDNRGIGIACLIHTGGGAALYGKGNFSGAIVRLNEDGTFNLMTGETDVGQGSDTALAQIAAEVLKVPMESIRVITGDTEITPASLGTWGSRVTYTGGNAVLAAARDMRRQMFAVASEMLETNIEDLEAKNGRVFVKAMEERWVTIIEIADECFKKKGIPLVGRGYFVDKNVIPVDSQTGYGNPYPTWAFGCQAVEVEVDPETGKVSITKVVAAHDLGKAINPMGAEGQIEGAVVQGIGYALLEGLKWENGRIVNPSFRDYKLPTFSDIFPITILLVESNDPDGPFGAKGVAEAGIVPTAAAVANAIYNAVGVRINSLPMTPEKILFALRRQRQT
jgi:4-hydroxybenzoyl-CoA reductase alpha subunit